MKKNYISFLLLMCLGLLNVVHAQAQKQKHTDRYYNSWRLGLNMGAMWQVADVRSTPGFAGGFTLEKGLCENKTHFFSLAIKGRGLWGNTYGLDYVRNYDIKKNPSLNGTYDPKVNYDTTKVGVAPFIYNNYKTKVAEGALELQVCFNQLRERTNILLNIWGGIGFTSYRTSVNLLDKNNQIYNYNLVDSSGSKALALSSHDFLLDNSYESYGTGSKKGNVLTLSPSCGIGLGYRFNDHISLLWEHKITFPQGTYSDYLDGIKASNNDKLGCVKDYYHYSSLTLLIRLGGHGKTKTTSNVDNYTPVETNTIVNIPTNTFVTSPTTSVVTQTPVAKPPVVTITNPPASPYNETVNRMFPVKANVYNVSQRSQLYVTFNGIEVKDYTWSGSTIQFTRELSVGNNMVAVTATNPAGNDSKSAVIVYSGVPPQITITTPGAYKVTSAQSNTTIYATILNVESQNFVSVKYNGQDFTAFSYNPLDKTFAMNTELAAGTNTIDITATNPFGKDIKSQLIVYKPVGIVTATATAAKSVSVTITDPTVNPYKSVSATYKVKAKVTGVNAQSQVTVTANSSPVPFNYTSGNVDFDVTISNSSVLVQVSAGNGRSTDSKSTVITYEAPKKITPPAVVIMNPNPSPYTTTLTSYSFKGQVKNITSNAQLEVKYNGMPVPNYVFDVNTGMIDYNANLTLNSNNIFEIKATNSFGSANASAIVKQEQLIEFDRQITICHKNADGTRQTIVIKQSEWAQHQSHGDVMGACPKIVVPTEIDNDITICHKNADGSRETMVIKQSTWPQHQSHGDVMGVCPKIVIPTEIDNDITICHKNADGSKQTIVIKQSQWPAHQAHGDAMGVCPKVLQDPTELDPDLVICHKNGDGTETKMTIKQSQWPAHQAHGDYVGGNCSVQTNTAASTSTIEICHNNGDGTKITMIIPSAQYASHRAHGDVLGACPPQSSSTNTTPVTPPMTICHNNGDGSKTTMTITSAQWTTHRGHGDALGTCPPEDKKITICHIPPGNNQNPQTIEINESAWPAHQAHGDTKGECAPADKKITICHIPPGNNQNPQTIEINESAWPAHQAHGDTKGACTEQKTNPGKGKSGINETGPENGNGGQSPGRTMQSKSEEPKQEELQKAEPRKLTPR